MLRVYHSNRMEQLVECLCGVLEQPLQSSLAAEQFVVQNTGLARWLNLRLAERFGIAANHEYLLPASFVWRQFRNCLPGVEENSPFDKEILFWHIFEQLPDLPQDEGFAPLHGYLESDANGLKRYQLARRIADVFDQYLVYRPQWVLDWDFGAEEHWQARLWRLLREDIQGEHRAALQQRFMALDLGEMDLPERVCVFGISSLAPTSLAVLRHLADFTEVHLFVLNPSLAYWGDIVPQRSLARLQEAWRRRGRPDVSELYETGNPLLAAWGRLGRDFQSLLYEDNVPEELDAYVEPAGERLLDLVQRDLLELFDRSAETQRYPIPADDGSIRIHVCHSPLREVEVLHDQLLELFRLQPDLQPRDLVVMAPDIDRYAPYVQAVFGGVAEQRYIPWSLADVSPRGESPLAELILQLLGLPDSRFAASEVMGILEIPEVQARFGLQAADLPQLRQWVQAAGIRWGLAEGSDGGENANSWLAGFQRLFFGYALPETVERYGTVAPVAGVEGGEARLLGILKAMLDRLGEWRDLFTRSHSAKDWHAHLNRALDSLLRAGDDEPALEQIRAALDRLLSGSGDAGVDAPLHRAVIKAFLEGELSVGGAAHRYAGGRVTFCAMVPMRAVPFRVVALLGLNDQDFPRRARAPSFDRMADDFQPGDRAVRDEDRHLFLEALLSARDTLYLSYVGADVRDNSELQPALMLSELQDYIQVGFELASPLLVHHPLQPFSRRYAVGEEGIFTYAGEWTLARTGQGEQSFAAMPIAAGEELPRIVELEQLERFFQHPARWFLRHRLGVGLTEQDLVLLDDEPFDLPFLDLYGLRQELLQTRIQGQDFQGRAELHRLRGELPRGPFAELLLEREQESIEDLGRAIRDLAAHERPALEVDLPLGEFRLQGWLGGITDQGLLTYRLSPFNGKDMIRLWLRHLVLNSIAEGDQARDSRHLDPKQEYLLPAFSDPEDARRQLQALLQLYWLGRQQPLAFHPKTSFIYSRALVEDKPEEKALEAALRTWQGNGYSKGEGDDADFQVAWRGGDPMGDEFRRISRQVFEPALQRLEM